MQIGAVFYNYMASMPGREGASCHVADSSIVNIRSLIRKKLESGPSFRTNTKE